MSLDEQTLRALFEKSQQSNPDKMQFTPEESSRFQKSFEDPEFRKLFADYMDELSDPKNREETEAYISQLEGEQKVPEGKELIRPEPVFVAKSYKEFKNDKKDKEKVFLNIVQSSKINTPSKTDTPKGTCWSVPYSLGPPHMEKDKSGDNAPCFDCCFHPEAIRLGMQHKEFKDLLVTTAMEGVEKLYQQQGQDVTIARDFHVVKGIDYKQGQVPTMMIAVASKENWNEKKGVKAAKAMVDSSTKPAPPAAQSKEAAVAAPTPPKPAADATKPAAGPAIKKGFLSNSKGAIYGDKLTTIRPKKEPESKAPSSGISLVDTPQASSIDSLNIPSAATATKSKNAGHNPGIQEVKKGESATAPASTAAGTASHKPTTRSDTMAGMTAVSTTKRQQAAHPPAPASPQLGSPSGSRDISATSPSGSDIADSEAQARAQPAEETAGGIATPKYTVKERGLVSMGDFENMKSTVQSNRPNELVYRVELPKITKASLVVLDIAERQLNLSYPDVYSLSIKLPYPVFDTKGTAKYDKASKSLTVTLPVRPPAAVSAGTSAATPTKDSLVREETSEDNDAEEQSSPAKSTTPVKKSSAGHSRWVEKAPVVGATDAAATTEATKAAAPPLSLKEEVQRQAEIALQQAQQAAAKAAVEAKNAPPPTVQKKVAPVAPTSAPVPATAVTTTSAVDGQEFITSATFAGKRPGYVFKRGDNGQGYYLDAKSPNRASPAKAAPAPAAPVITKTEPASAGRTSPKAFPFECRQTKQALAVIIEVPHIDKASVAIDFQEYSVTVSFRAFADAAGGNRIGTVQYGAVLKLNRADCPAGLDVSLCRFDAADHNMALVLTKALPAFWHNSQTSKTTTAGSATGESKAGDFASEEAHSLLEVLPYATSAAAAVSKTSVPTPVQSTAASLANAEANKALKALESSIQSLQFSSSDALFELD